MSEVMQPFPSATIPNSAHWAEGRCPFGGTLLRETGTETLPCEPCSLSADLKCSCLLVHLWEVLSAMPACVVVLSHAGTKVSCQVNGCFWFFYDTLAEKVQAGDCTGRQNCQGITDILTFEKWHFDLFHKQAGFLWVTWPLLLENWC